MMNTDAKKIFISYRHSDGYALATKIKSIFEQSAYDAFLDDVDLHAGLWNEELQAAIISCSVFVPIITDGYIKRLKNWWKNIIKKEFECALSCHGASGVVPFFSNEIVAKRCSKVMVKMTNERIKVADLQSSISDIKQLMRLVSGICPTAYLEKAEFYSLQFINAWKSAQTGLLYDPQIAMQRRLSVDASVIECTADNIIDLLGMHKEICISGDGGCGKTFLLQQLFDMLHKRHNYIAIYVKLSEVHFSKDDDNPILSHIQKQIADKDDNLIRELHEEDHAPNVVFLLDGLNEVTVNQGQAVRAINDITEESGVSNIILTTRYLPSSLASKFAPAHICDLNDEEIRHYLEAEDFLVEPQSILRLPLYLRLYKLSTMNMPSKMRGQSQDLQTKREILEEVFVSHPVDKFGKALTDQLRAAYNYLLPFLCFRMANNNTLKISQLDLISNIDLCLKSIPNEARLKASLQTCFCFENGITVDVLLNSNYDLLIQGITAQIFPEVSDGKAGANRIYQISHQDIRDFFASHYIKSSLDYILHIGLTGDEGMWKDSLELFDDKTFDADAAPLILQTLKKQLVLPLKEAANHFKLCSSLLHFLYYLSSNTISSVHNGSKRKRAYCELFKESLDSARRFIVDNKELYYVNPIDSTVTGILVLDAEIHRRLEEYRESNSVSIQLLSLAEFVNDDGLRKQVKNNIAKCTLYHAYDVAHFAGCRYSFDAENLYQDAIGQLRENLDFELSANLFAMLLVNPDPVSRKYIDKLFGSDMADRRFRAYTIEKEAYKSSRGTYSLQTLLSYILHGYVKVAGIDSVKQPIVEKNSNNQVWDIRKNKNDVRWIAEMFIQELSKEFVPSIVHCFRGLILLQDSASFDDAMEELENSYQINLSDNSINASCLGCFVHAVLNSKLSPEAQTTLLDNVWRTMDKKLTEHSVDNFDFAYVLVDIKTAWEGIKCRYSDTLSKELFSRIEEKLKVLSQKYQQENQKWNP